MIKINCRQGTPEWFAARCGVITASSFAAATSVMKQNRDGKKVGEPTSAADRYCADTACELINGEPFSEPVKTWVLDRGHALEDEARARYSERTGGMVFEQGFVLDNSRTFGYSTDGEIDDDGLLEVKCPIDTTKIADMLITKNIDDYMHQIQGGMWITGRKWCDLLMFAPMLESVGNDLIIVRVERDETFIAEMAEKLADAYSRVQHYRSIFSSKAVGGC